ncbi:peptide/nickel transport system ATP-binding protein [Stella humosa]|uniref:Peptide/nickel transport system ATP-binding protein n=1 Tax=Stella humosa TaxID=94 RepID=A0A3N1KRM9_9PROT|nr:ABC transporter ATP-binding protein [Stella humosa]ROP84543.1 peptide/nickel transport system ATP-binding protein [Stella humosa]BBK34063.1 peptide ABC transporter ATP-binding protein [Stella humosa]
MSALLEIDGLEVDLPVAAGTLRAVRGIRLSVERGQTLCVVGESGCGKSLTSLAIMDLLPARAVRRARRMTLAGEDLLSATPARMADLRGQRLAMIFQEPMTSLNPAWSIGNQLEEALLRHRRVRRAEARDRAVHLLERVGISSAASRLGQYPHQLSGGLRQRVMIAMALMCGPDLIIADEPTTALDVTIQAQILRLLADLQREFSMGLLLITHDLGVVSRIADRVAVMYAGEIVETGTALEVLAHPRHPYTQGLIGCIPRPGTGAAGQRLGTIPGMVPNLARPIAGCGFIDRCPERKAHACRQPVPLAAIGTGRASRCVLAAAAEEERVPA